MVQQLKLADPRKYTEDLSREELDVGVFLSVFSSISIFGYDILFNIFSYMCTGFKFPYISDIYGFLWEDLDIVVF